MEYSSLYVAIRNAQGVVKELDHMRNILTVTNGVIIKGIRVLNRFYYTDNHSSYHDLRILHIQNTLHNLHLE